ncbi:single-stranded DNA-binding protein [Frankia sp. Cppng1_Ct_nod]|uniref:single-stranded DNA-binding protein n=1 Tax=Frankia sp. Cppng1_Ct_nod TaxID=2897162 RepID=UPI001040FB84|nr:single-stranded DNA-binding protein [Frankia sp. Cppng1_Ct_nod]
MIEASLTLLGNLVDDPELRCTQNGNFVCSLRLACTSRRFDRTQNRWVDSNTVFVTVTCWRQLAENVGASLHKGDRTLVIGRLRQRSFETQDGSRRVVYEVDADAIGVDLTRQSAEVRRVVRSQTEGDGPAGGSESVPDHDSPAMHNGQTRFEGGAEYHDGGLTDAGADNPLSRSTADGVAPDAGFDTGRHTIPAQRPATV